MGDKSSLSESTSLLLLRQGDRQAFSKLYDLYWEMLYCYVVRVLRDKEDAMDVVQDTFISLWQQRAALGEVQSLQAYLKAMARYKAMKCIRDNIRKHDYLESLLDCFTQHEESPEGLMVAHELRGIIDAEIERLPTMMRKVFILSRRENLSYKEIASKLVISDKTVKKQISNALRILRSKINDPHVTSLLLLLVLEGHF
ncbi:RNA polymerase sigma-70 factor [Olivibacter sp. SDN3]|uniref:RNA polymerase sigma factor n=1 Tax=Olivibacter sp. SDN3 TaxID=2764720 RepID=UPI001651A3F8|nr:RNA polymerase sigma-70 factor [Olivibacter sp. SDN3]QNL51072.1 RNA polymerase sigma-70 factor [Olivibacter sp. SDN3]